MGTGGGCLSRMLILVLAPLFDRYTNSTETSSNRESWAEPPLAGLPVWINALLIHRPTQSGRVCPVRRALGLPQTLPTANKHILEESLQQQTPKVPQGKVFPPFFQFYFNAFRIGLPAFLGVLYIIFPPHSEECKFLL